MTSLESINYWKQHLKKVTDFSKFVWFCLLVFNKLQSFARKRNQEVSSIFSLLNSVVIRICSHMALHLCMFQFLKKCQHAQVYFLILQREVCPIFWNVAEFIYLIAWLQSANWFQFACNASLYKRENPGVTYILLVVYKYNRYLHL